MRNFFKDFLSLPRIFKLSLFWDIFFVYWIKAIENAQSVFSIYNYGLSCVRLELTINITLELFSYVIDNGIIFLHHVFLKIWAVIALHNFVSFFFYSKWLNPFSPLFNFVLQVTNLLHRILAVFPDIIAFIFFMLVLDSPHPLFLIES